MEERKLQPYKDEPDEHFPELADSHEMLETLMENLKNVSGVQEIETLTNLILKAKKELQEIASTRLKDIEEQRKRRFERRIGQVRQVISLIIGVTLAAGGPFVFLYIDTKLGTFLISVGFTTLGLSSGIVKSFFDKINNKK